MRTAIELGLATGTDPRLWAGDDRILATALDVMQAWHRERER